MLGEHSQGKGERCHAVAIMRQICCPPLSPVPGYLDALEGAASAEGFLDRLLGTNCFSAAVGELTADCRRMEQEAKTRLALRLGRCPDSSRECCNTLSKGYATAAQPNFADFTT